MSKSARFIFYTILIGFILPLASCNSHKEYRRSEGMIWHTTYHVTYRAAEDLTDSIVAELNRVGASLNAFDSGSLISRINAGDSVKTDPDFRTVYDMSKRVNKISDGAFDPTLGPLITAWGFGKGHKATSDTLRIDSLLAFTGIEKTRLSEYLLVKDDPRIEFNFSAIAKGYGCDCVAEMFMRNGIEDFLVEIGGEIRCGGSGPSGEKWRISIDKPIRGSVPSHESQCVIDMTDMGMATSGNYRNYHQNGSQTYGHTISAKTGRPTETDILSATVIAPTAMEADALATAMMAMGSQKAEECAKQNALCVMLVLSDMSVWETPEFSKLITRK